MDRASPDSEYFLRRADEERTAAARSTDPRARKTHIDLAERYAEAARSAATAAGINGERSARAESPRLRPEFRILP